MRILFILFVLFFYKNCFATKIFNHEISGNENICQGISLFGHECNIRKFKTMWGQNSDVIIQQSNYIIELIRQALKNNKIEDYKKLEQHIVFPFTFYMYDYIENEYHPLYGWPIINSHGWESSDINEFIEDLKEIYEKTPKFFDNNKDIENFFYFDSKREVIGNNAHYEIDFSYECLNYETPKNTEFPESRKYCTRIKTMVKSINVYLFQLSKNHEFLKK